MGSILSRDNSAVVPDLPDEIIRSEILTRLPVKSVVRFRCVCKSWNSLLSGDPDFIKSHLTLYSMNLNNGALICRCIPHAQSDDPLTSRFQLGGSVHGLVCVYNYDRDASSSISCIGLWNPAINHYKNIPIPPSARSTCIQSKHNFRLGIGFDPITNDYKVVYITMKPDHPFVADVYSCNAGSWAKTSAKSTFLSRGEPFPNPTIVHGRPYWYNDFAGKYYVMFFDVQEEVFRSLPGIGFINKLKKQKIMVNLRETLAFMYYNNFNHSFRSVDFYVFNERCGIWTKNYTVGPIIMPERMYFDLCNCFLSGDLLFGSRNQLKLVSFSSETHAVNNLDSHVYFFDSCRRWYLPFVGIYGYTESLVSVQGMNAIHVDKAGVDILIIEKSL
ncbi:F-box/kelch-repeat protein At3g23880-like [Apium graveolens]|uniref:F-box/kelch-repeat protein At3g23880-like n=1 Tax=Apium graveolens TaxID=4045 RepID=UPI003D7BBA6D